MSVDRKNDPLNVPDFRSAAYHGSKGHPMACCMRHCAHHEEHDRMPPPREHRPCTCEDAPRRALAAQVEAKREEAQA